MTLVPISEGAMTALAVRFDLKSYIYGYLDAQVGPSMNNFASAKPRGGMHHQEIEDNCNTSLSTTGADRDGVVLTGVVDCQQQGHLERIIQISWYTTVCWVFLVFKHLRKISKGAGSWFEWNEGVHSLCLPRWFLGEGCYGDSCWVEVHIRSMHSKMYMILFQLLWWTQTGLLSSEET